MKRCSTCNKPRAKKHISERDPAICSCADKPRLGRVGSGLVRRYVKITPEVDALLKSAATNADANDQVYGGALLTVALEARLCTCK